MANIQLQRWFKRGMETCMGPLPMVELMAMAQFSAKLRKLSYRRVAAYPANSVTGRQASGLVLVCPLTSRRKPYPFALPVSVDKIDGAVLVDHLKSLDWAARNAAFHSKADPALLAKVRVYLCVL